MKRHIQGFIDGVTRNGFVQGWASNERHPWIPSLVRLRCQDSWVAEGLAHHFRADVAAQLEAGWCGFRLRLSCPVETVRTRPVFLVDQAGDVISRMDQPRFLPDEDDNLTSIDAVTSADPTTIASIHELRGCENLLATFIRAQGVDAFIRAAYVYVLGRPADTDGLRVYGGRFRQGCHQPSELLQVLACSDEHHTRKPLLIAPTDPAFPFLLHADG